MKEGTAAFQLADIPMDIILIQRKGTKLSADAAKPIWLACLLQEILPIAEFWLFNFHFLIVSS